MIKNDDKDFITKGQFVCSLNQCDQKYGPKDHDVPIPLISDQQLKKKV
jgi:hypothetical protein